MLKLRLSTKKKTKEKKNCNNFIMACQRKGLNDYDDDDDQSSALAFWSRIESENLVRILKDRFEIKMFS